MSRATQVGLSVFGCLLTVAGLALAGWEVKTHGLLHIPSALFAGGLILVGAFFVSADVAVAAVRSIAEGARTVVPWKSGAAPKPPEGP